MGSSWWTYEWDGENPPPETTRHTDGSLSRTFDPGAGRDVEAVRVREERHTVAGETRRHTRVGYRYGDWSRPNRWWERDHRWVGRVIGTAVVLVLTTLTTTAGALGSGPVGAVAGWQTGALMLWAMHRARGRGLWRAVVDWWAATWLLGLYLPLSVVVLALMGWAGVLALSVISAWWIGCV